MSARVERVASDVVVLAFVLNVIEDPAERRATLQDAYRLAGEVLCIGTMRPGAAKGTPHGDGVVTTRGTFQRPYGTAELRALCIAELTPAAVVGRGSGCCFVFPSEAAANRYAAISEGPA